ncbi:hypothetical protein K431DRAFT_55139 [Polychaeton citri CBS 116435]|uniref:Uncharacterized protein n=1 Tax=Polychaeton citri CBS 116435 TaxID=1314669 RepID=A0A9P4QGB4_9PEZI|nr:hypothetical protein K431DRAFT_55139 [Polychaeton citri CBS 116435]
MQLQSSFVPWLPFRGRQLGIYILKAYSCPQAKLKAGSNGTKETPLTNGDSPNTQSHTSPHEEQPLSQPPQDSNNAIPQSTLLALRNTVESLERQNSSLTTHNAHILHMHNLYEDALTSTTDYVRRYVYEQQNHVIALHQHYTGLLQQSRSETIDAQIVHQEWQDGLSRLSGTLRETLRDRESGVRPWRVKVANLKEENRVLRSLAGWNPPSEDEDDFSGSEDEEIQGRGA